MKNSNGGPAPPVLARIEPRGVATSTTSKPSNSIALSLRGYPNRERLVIDALSSTWMVTLRGPCLSAPRATPT